MTWSSPGSRVGNRLLKGRVLPHEDAYYNLVWGLAAAPNVGPQPGGYNGTDTLTNGGHNTCLGYKAGNSLVSLDYGNVHIGRLSGALCSNGSPNLGLNTCIGDGSGYNGYAPTTAVSYSKCVALGRSAGAGWTTDAYTIAVGHAPMFKGGGNTNVIAIGNTAGGDNVDGTGSVNYGAINDTDVIYIGQYTGKTSAAGRTNCIALGKHATVPIRDNVAVLGNGLAAAVTKAGWWNGDNRQTISGITGNTTATAAQLTGGFILLSGSPGASYNLTTDTAANIVAAGPGNGCETPVSKILYVSNISSQQATVVGGSGVITSGSMTVSASGGIAILMMVITNSGAGSEAVTVYRVF